MEKITIKGVVVFDVSEKRYRFLSDWSGSEFTDGVCRSEYVNYVLICKHQIDIEVPEVDLVKPQLDSLDAKEAALTATYQAAKTAIQSERQSLLAIEFETGVPA